MTWDGVASEGYFRYRDESPTMATEAYREYFFSLMKNSNTPDLDMTKRIPLHILNLFVPDWLFERLKFPVPVFLAMASFYFVARRLLGSEGFPEGRRELLSVAGSLAYMVNPITTQLILSFYPMLVFAAFPAFFILLFEGMRSHSRPKVFASALIASFMALMVVHSLIYIAVAFAAISPALIRRRHEAQAIIADSALFAFVVLCCMLFALLPYFSLFDPYTAPRGSFQPTVSNIQMFSSPADLPKPMLLDFNSFWWPYVSYHYPMGTLFYPLAAILMGAIICFAILERSEWGAMALFALGLLFFFAKGAQGPFPWIYETLMFRLPFGWLMRVPMKFLHIIPFFVSILFVRAVAGVHRNSPSASAAFAAFAILFLSISAWPLFTGDVAGVLAKKDNSQLDIEYSAIAAAIGANHPSALSAMGFDSSKVPADVSYGRRYLRWELAAYSAMQDWDGLRAFSNAGFSYVIVPPGSINIPPDFLQVYAGERMSLYRISENTTPFSVSSSAYSCYSSFAALRSLQQEPPPGEGPTVAFFPYLSPAFPEGFARGADHVLVDSTSPYVAYTGDGTVFPFPKAGRWERNGETPFDKESSYGHSLKSSYLFSSMRNSLPNNIAIAIADEGDIEFRFRDNISKASSPLSYGTAPGSQGMSLAVAELGIAPLFQYAANISASGSAKNLTAGIALLDGDGKTISFIRLIDASGGFNASYGREFFVPASASKAILFISAYSSEDGLSCEISRFSLVPTYPMDAPATTGVFSVPDDGDYSIYLRYYEGSSGGMMASSVDGAAPFYIGTGGVSDRIAWKRVFSGHLSMGEHSMTIRNLGGLNAVNVAYVVPGSVEDDPFEGKTVIYRLVAKNDFKVPASAVTITPGASSYVLTTLKGPVSTVIDVVSPGQYEIAIAGEGAISLSIDGQAIEGSAYLGRGTHTVSAAPQNGSAILDYVTLMRRGAASETNADIVGYERTGPSSYSLDIESDGAYYLSMARDFSIGWVAEVGGKKYAPIPSFGSITTFYINETGNKRINVYYEPQGLMLFWAAAGAIGLAGAAAYSLKRSGCSDKNHRKHRDSR